MSTDALLIAGALLILSWCLWKLADLYEAAQVRWQQAQLNALLARATAPPPAHAFTPLLAYDWRSAATIDEMQQASALQQRYPLPPMTGIGLDSGLVIQVGRN